jgi:hypothetical protein
MYVLFGYILNTFTNCDPASFTVVSGCLTSRSVESGFGFQL